MTNIIDEIKPRKNALQANEEVLENTKSNTTVVTKSNQFVFTPKSKKVSKLVTFRISEERIEKLAEFAKKHNTSKQDVLNNLIDNLG